jgi:hypothetical protein
MRKRIIEAPPGSMWGMSFKQPPSVISPGAEGEGFYLEAFTKMREAKENGDLSQALKTLNCFAMITSATARGLAAMHGYRIGFQPPYMPEEQEPGSEEAGG